MRRGLAWVVFAVVAAACAATPRPAMRLDGWREIRMPDFTLVGDIHPDALRELARELSVFGALVRRVSSTPPDPSPVSLRMYVFADPLQARRFTSDAAGILVPTLAGYFSILYDGGADFLTRQVLFHEYVHYALRRNRRVAYPRWYDEGTSEYLGATVFREGLVIVGAAPAGRLASLLPKGPLPLETLFAARAGTRVAVDRYYATAWAFVHLQNSTSNGRRRLGAFVVGLTRGEPWREAYDASFDVELDELDSVLAQHVERLQRGARLDFHVPVSALGPWPKGAESAVAPAVVAYELGCIVRRMGEAGRARRDFETACSLFETALIDDPGDARARAATAWCSARHGEFEVAQAALERAIRDAPDDPDVALEAGRVAALQAAEEGPGAFTDAMAALERAVQLDPESPDAHAAVGRAYADAGEPSKAIEALERARALGAWSPAVDLGLAEAYLELDERGRAEQLLVPVGADAHGGDTAEKAQRLLREIRAGAGSTREPVR